MPSASTKVEITASSEALEPIKKVLTVVDKKVRNLEKRKLKLDAYREKQDGGETLEPDQLIAVARYDQVLQNLEFARELQKQFTSINTDAEKALKKQAKRGKLEKQNQEVKRVKEVLQLQGLLDNLGSDAVRIDFQTGKHGAIVLTDENLEQLDELFKLISPTREAGADYHQRLGDAADHIVSLLDSREKPVAGSTYKELKELLDLISGCGYFERTPVSEEEQKEGEEEFEVVQHQDVPDHDSEEVHRSLPPEVSPEPSTADMTQKFERTSLDTQAQQVPSIEAESFFSGPVTPQAVVVQQQQHQQHQQHQQQQQQAAEAFAKRPFQDIVSSVQGSFNFLQESIIEVESKQREFSPHMDPAVVAAHPMPKSMGLPPTSQKPDSSAFGNKPYTQTSLASDIIVSSHAASQHSATVDLNYSQAGTVQSQADFVANSGFAPNNLSHTMQTDILFAGPVTGSKVEKGSTGMPHNVMGAGSTDPSLSQFEIPPQLPMPPGHDQTSQDLSLNEKKGYPMNPNASEFHSLYTPADQEDESNNKSDNTFQESTYTNSNFQNQRNPSRGGYKNDRGGRGNRGGMSNGYQRGGGGGRNSAGGYERSNSGNNYQGYPSRDNYRPDGYQGYSGSGGNNFSSGGGGSGYQKRSEGGRGAPRGGSGFRGGARGGQGYNRGGSSYNRGGAQGAAPSGARTGNSQGFGRPNFNQQQVAQ